MMDPLSTTIPGSRQPISAVSSIAFCNNSTIYGSSQAQSQSPSTSSSIRRKPRITYQSPSGDHPADLRIEQPATHAKLPSSSRRSTLHSSEATFAMFHNYAYITGGVKKRKSNMGPPGPLPLYHPLGPLALSLPELDPETFGLPRMLNIDDASRRASNRTRRPVAKLRDATQDKVLAMPAPSPNDSAPQDVVKEKASPRKKRGGGGAGNKRKRKDVDDGDSTYPAKRTRQPRSSAAATPDEPAAQGEAAEVAEDQQEEKKPERRSRRTRASAVRRNSSASEATNTSVYASVTMSVRSKKERIEEGMPVDNDAILATGGMDTPKDGGQEEQEEAQNELDAEGPVDEVKPDEEIIENTKKESGKQEKEEGELSEEPEAQPKEA